MKKTHILAIGVIALLVIGAQSLFFDFGDAPDPTFPTFLDINQNGGPALLAVNANGELITQIVLGTCVTSEDRPQVDDLDACDDARFLLDFNNNTMQVNIFRKDATATETYWINFLADLDDDGRWEPDTAEWLVRNCPVYSPGLEKETIICPTVPLDTAINLEDGIWVRIMVADRQAPSSGWDGSAFFAPGEARGEVEDHGPDATPTPTPVPANDVDFGDAPDPGFPTTHGSNGPFIPGQDDTLILGYDITYENAPNMVDVDPKDDGLLAMNLQQGNAVFYVAANGAWTPRNMYINMAVDLNLDGDWQDPDEWVVQNCSVPANVQHFFGGQVQCNFQARNFAPQNILQRFISFISQLFGQKQGPWVRVLLSEWQIPLNPAWYGQDSPSALRWGEVEDYTQVQPVPYDTPTPTITPPPTDPPTATATPTITPTPSKTPTPSITPTASDTSTPSRTPTELPIIVKVKDGITSACRWGPSGTFSLQKYDLPAGTELEAIGIHGNWVLVRFPPPDNRTPCWIYIENLDFMGNPSDLDYIPFEPFLPTWDDGNPPVSGGSASRSGNNVTITWTESSLKGDEDFNFYHVTAIVCRNGQLVELFFQTTNPSITIQVDDDCSQASSVTVRVRHDRGYSKPTTINLP